MCLISNHVHVHGQLFFFLLEATIDFVACPLLWGILPRLMEPGWSFIIVTCGTVTTWTFVCEMSASSSLQERKLSA